jgi:hypothetical protein
VDPVTLIVAALVAGASSGLKDTAGAAVKDAYAELKLLVRKYFGGDPSPARSPVEDGVAAIERNPRADVSALHAALQRSGAGEDAALVRAAAELLTRADPAGAALGKYRVSISGGKGIVVGNEGTVSMTFNDGD